MKIRYLLFLFTEKILNTLQTELYYLYNQNEKTNAVGFNAVYGAWFPYLNLGTEYTFDREALTVIRSGNGINWIQGSG